MIKLSEDLFQMYIKIIWFLLITPMIYALYTKDYFLILILFLPLLIWTLKGKVFRLKSIRFNESKIFINDNEYYLNEIESVRIKAFKLSYIKINGKKYHFTTPFSEFNVNNKKEILLNRIDKQKDKTYLNGRTEVKLK